MLGPPNLNRKGFGEDLREFVLCSGSGSSVFLIIVDDMCGLEESVSRSNC